MGSLEESQVGWLHTLVSPEQRLNLFPTNMAIHPTQLRLQFKYKEYKRKMSISLRTIYICTTFFYQQVSRITGFLQYNILVYITSQS